MHKIVYSTSYNNCKIVHSTMYIKSTYKTCTVVTFIVAITHYIFLCMFFFEYGDATRWYLFF